MNNRKTKTIQKAKIDRSLVISMLLLCFLLGSCIKKKHNPAPTTSKPTSSINQRISVADLRDFIGNTGGYTKEEFFQDIMSREHDDRICLVKPGKKSRLKTLEKENKISGKMKEVVDKILVSKKCVLPPNRYYLTGEFIKFAESAAGNVTKAQLKQLLADFKQTIEQISPGKSTDVVYKEENGTLIFEFKTGKGLTEDKYQFVQNLCVEIEAEINKLP